MAPPPRAGPGLCLGTVGQPRVPHKGPYRGVLLPPGSTWSPSKGTAWGWGGNCRVRGLGLDAMLVVGLAWSSGVLRSATIVGLWDSIIPKDTEAFFLFFFFPFYKSIANKASVQLQLFTCRYTHVLFWGVISTAPGSRAGC